MTDWEIFRGAAAPHDGIERLPASPPWRQFQNDLSSERGSGFQVSEEEKQVVNAALYLRRPLLVTGRPGTGKSTLAYAVAWELQLGPVLAWRITTRSTLQAALYRYDAIGRLHDASMENIRREQDEQREEIASADVGRYITLGPLGTALLPRTRPRVLLIDEIDKSDIDLPNDLLHVFEEGEYEIPELTRLSADPTVEVLSHDGGPVKVTQGRIQCTSFPVVVMTSNGEREFPPAFTRRCLSLEMKPPDSAKLTRIVMARLAGLDDADDQLRQAVSELLDAFLSERDDRSRMLATDQLLNAIYLTMSEVDPRAAGREALKDALWKSLGDTSS